MNQIFTHRYVAKFTIEAETPLSVGSGEKGLVIDRVVAKDANGLPYIPGTSLTGVLRHSLNNKEWAKEIFGYRGEDGQGSRLIVSSAFIIGEDGKTVLEGLRNIDWSSPYYSHFNRLPERDHVSINHKGAADAENHGKFDEELVHKGTRFVFEIELIGTAQDSEIWQNLLAAFSSPTFRIGAGTRKGFGKLKVITTLSKMKTYQLNNGDLPAYLRKSSSLNEETDGWEIIPTTDSTDKQEGWKKYVITIKPKDFFLFSAGFGDDDADNKSKTEKYFEWMSGKPQLVESEFLLIPATSVKGAIAHRVAYHYNSAKKEVIGKSTPTEFSTSLNINAGIQEMERKFTIDNLSLSSDSSEWDAIANNIEKLTIEQLQTWKDFENNLDTEVHNNKNIALPVGNHNVAVKALFGFAKDTEMKQEGLRGRVVLDDIYLPYDKSLDKVFNHVKIDRFTNATIDGALFQEKASQYKQDFKLVIWVDENAFEEDEHIKPAFEKALNDLVSEKLPLGGKSSKGHGIFTGTIKA